MCVFANIELARLDRGLVSVSNNFVLKSLAGFGCMGQTSFISACIHSSR